MAGTNITYRGYVLPKGLLTDTARETLEKELTVTPYVPKDYQIGTPKQYPVYLESDRNYYVPKYYGLEHYGPPEQCDVFVGRTLEDKACDFQGSMREEQVAACKAYLKAATSMPWGGGGILNLPCGFGKTVIALHLFSRIRLKTLIIVHKDFLLQQWKERIAQFLPHASVGMLKAAIVDVGDDRDIVIASLQSLSMKSYDVKALFSSFGFVIVDECHHTSAEVFCNALKKTCFRYTLGLSATLNRKDGLARVFKWFLGPVVYKPPRQASGARRPVVPAPQDGSVRSIEAARRAAASVIVMTREFFDLHPDYATERRMMGGTKLNVSRMINQICEYQPRNVFIAEHVRDILKREPGRRVLILSDRREHLRCLVTELESVGVITGPEDYGYYQGGLDQETLKRSERKKIILGTFQFVAEGFDVPGLDTLVLASPKSDIVQAVGRILRQRPEERTYTPLVLDIVDDISLFPAQAKKRRAHYTSKKYYIDEDRPENGFEVGPRDVDALFKQGVCHILDDADANENVSD